ncbi:hypothetical protein CgunFtcFv8_021586 [Champsocephalus gunnari]|uniref:Ig-like domain-containing protein n=1 Tax=Champsocephalus gunnari TaxID=52237 RepID=A0AAN8DXD3_CHAGU|nr:hypothetical protein CgunFtcFv8_021586 [Champsocephalus gunnari]
MVYVLFDLLFGRAVNLQTCESGSLCFPAAPRPASPQTIQADEGANATVWCRFIRPEHFAPTALHWTVNVTKAVLFSRHGGWIDPDAADAQYKLRTSVNWEDPARGTLLVNICNVTPSDSGSYEGVVSGKLAGHDHPLELHCSVELIVAPRDEQRRTERKDSSTSPAAGGGPGKDAAEKRNDVQTIVLPCVLIAAVAVTIMLVVAWKRGVIRSCKKEGEPKTSEGDQQSAAEEGLVGSEVADGLLKGQSRQNRPFCIPSQT